MALDWAIEISLRESGEKIVCGCDEAGRGPLCGPVVAAAVILPEGLIALDKNAFRYCATLQSIQLPSTLESIGEYAFYRCENLTEIIIPDGVSALGNRAFEGCSRLIEVTLPGTLETIYNYTFFECHGRLTIHAPAGSPAEKYAGTKGYSFVATD